MAINSINNSVNSFDEDVRLTAPEYTPSDGDIDVSLRPKTMDDYIGQNQVKENLSVYMEAALKRSEPLDHVLLYGPPGLGKTTLAGIIANTMGTTLHTTSGPAIEKPGDLAALLTNLNAGDVLFIDEIHRLSRSVEEVLYPAMEDRMIDIIIGKGPSARSTTSIPSIRALRVTMRASSSGVYSSKRSLETVAAAVGEESVTIEDVYEPYLMQIGFLSRTPRGRTVTPAGYRHLGFDYNG